MKNVTEERIEMTAEEAARILGPKTSREALDCWAYDPEKRFAVCNEACRVAARVLRAHSAKLDRSRWEGCPDCIREWGVLDTQTNRFAMRERHCCGSCGRPLKEQAWAELERRCAELSTDLLASGEV